MYRLLGELKRRRVLNTASLFVIGAWVLLQVAEVLQDMLPPGFLRWLLIALVALYPLVIVAGCAKCNVATLRGHRFHGIQ